MNSKAKRGWISWIGGNQRRRVRGRDQRRRFESLEQRAMMTADLEAGLVGYWPLDEIAGGSVADEAGENPGVVQGAQSVLGQLEHGLRFDGADDAVLLGRAEELPESGEISIAAWVAPQATNGLRNILAHGYVVGPSNGEVFLRINDGSYQIGSWDGADHLASFPISGGDIGAWTHLVGLYDGTAWRLFRNGVEVAATTDATGAVHVGDDWSIGAHGSGSGRFFAGDIDELRVYDRALNSEEIALLAAQAGHSPDAQDRTIALPATVTIGHAVGSVPVVDPDIGDAYTFAITGGNSSGAFAIDEDTGEITVVDPLLLDFVANDYYELTVEVSEVAAPQRADVSTAYVTSSTRFSLASPESAVQAQSHVVTLAGPTVPGLSWQVNWGDGVVDTIAAGLATAAHVFTAFGDFSITALVGDAFALLALAAPAAVNVKQYVGLNLLVNGSFEEAFVADEGFQAGRTWHAYAQIPGWNRDLASIPSPPPLIELQANGLFAGFAAQHGKQYLELDGDQNGYDGAAIEGERGRVDVWQEVTVPLGRSFKLSLQAAGRPGTAADENKLRVTVTNTSTNENVDQFQTTSLTIGEWTAFERQFTLAGSGLTKLRITLRDAGATDDTLGTFVDNVRLEMQRDASESYVEARRVAEPVEQQFTEIKQLEHFETESEFRYRVQGAFAAAPSLHWMVTDGEAEEPLATGAGGEFDYAFANGSAGRWTVLFWSDTDGDHALDFGEALKISNAFYVKPIAEKVIDMVYSSCLAGDLIHPALLAGLYLTAGTNALLRKDSPDDWRALVDIRLNTESVAEFPAQSCGVPDPIPDPPFLPDVGTYIDPVYAAGQVGLIGATASSPGFGHELVLVNIFQSGGVTFKGVTPEGVNASIINLPVMRIMTIVHELGHQASLKHAGHGPKHIMFQPGDFSGVDDIRNEVTFSDVQAYETKTW